ncbi:MAG: RAMP superfamily CRISPR-associated protein [Deltaproteobacteria bacterium]|nr:RAMP superfamily CRISPR-associated protein [Deltaproteobacteria bacterium]
MMNEIKTLKGGTFLNRYVIRLKLTARTPFHIGSGLQTEREGLVDDNKINKEHKKLKVNAVAVDGNGSAYIPGSTLRGALRDWLRHGNAGMTEKMAGVSADDIATSSDLERIFGTQHNEGKLEVWDAYCTSRVDEQDDNNGQMCFWNKKRMTYVAKSVAINPETGTAEDGKLYNYELVPAGAQFSATFSAQNLSPREAELICAVLNGFDHEENPIAIGAMTKLDFGRFKVEDFAIYRLDQNNMGDWRNKAQDNAEMRAGYDLLVDEAFDLEKINKAEFNKLKAATLPEPIDASIHREEWTLNLETPLVVRSGGRFVWKNADKKKTRNYRMEFNWMLTDKEGWHHVSDLYHSVEIKDRKIVPYYHIPSSSVRGALRAWTIEHLLKREHWDIEKYLKPLKASVLENKTDDQKRLDPILDLFGFAIEGTDKAVTKEYTKAGRLTINVHPFSTISVRPAVDGNNWDKHAANVFGPTNASRHIKPRNPLDRITQAAKEGGLHNNLEFSKDQKLILEIKILSLKDFDKQLLARWEKEINAGQILLGGLSGIGRGRVKVLERKETISKEAQNG